MPSPTQDTQAVLLLCAKLGQREGTDAAKPLTARQYSALAKWLQERSLRPCDLLQPSGRAQLNELQLPDITKDQLDRLLDRGAALAVLVERWTNSGIWIVSREDDEYPTRYRSYLQHKAPPVIYGVGEQASLQRGGLAIVGSRHASEEDTNFAQRIGAGCAEQKITVISGAAKGIDSESMMAAIDRQGTAIGVLADGLGRAAVAACYHEAILDGRLTLISPYEPESRWFTYTAMDRNKLIYALADAALVVASSDGEGGTWAGAVEALKQKQIPIYVKASGEVPAGNRKLIHSGGIEFLEETLTDLSKLFEKSQSPIGLTFAQSTPSIVDHQESNQSSPEAVADIPLCSSVSSVVKTLPSPSVASKKDRAAQKKSEDDSRIEAILEVLADPMDERSIAGKLNLSSSQARTMLKRAVEDGRVRKLKKRPVQYARTSTPLPLFENEPEAAPAKGS